MEFEKNAVNEYIQRLYEEGEKENEPTSRPDVVVEDGPSVGDVHDEPKWDDRTADPRVNHDTGMLHGATLKVGGKHVHIVSGKVVTREDGTIDDKASDQTIVAYNDETGEKEMFSPKDFRSLDEPKVSDALPLLAFQDGVSFVDKDGVKRHGTINNVDADGMVEVVTDDGRVERYDKDEFNSVVDEVERDGETVFKRGGRAEEGSGAPTEEVRPTEEKKPIEGKTKGVTEEVEEKEQDASQTDVVLPQENASQTALGRIPKDESGEPKYEVVDAGTAWDAILEQTEGDEGMAESVVKSMVEDKKRALKVAEESKAKAGGTIGEKIRAEKERQAVIDGAKADLAKWEEIAAERGKRVNAPKEEVAPMGEGDGVAKGDVAPKVEDAAEEKAAKVGEVEAKEETMPKGEAEEVKSGPKVDETTEEVVAKEGDEMRKKERRENIVSNMGDRYSLSDEQSNNGECFVQNGDGSTNLADIPDEIFNTLGVKPIPFKLTETMAWHVFEHHKKEAKMNSVSDAIDFVLSVINNVDHVRKGRDNSYIFSIESTYFL